MKRAGPTAIKVVNIKFIVGIFLTSCSHYTFACFFKKVKHIILSKNTGMCVRMVLFPALEFNIFMFVSIYNAEVLLSKNWNIVLAQDHNRGLYRKCRAKIRQTKQK
jgi:hypothetical protein